MATLLTKAVARSIADPALNGRWFALMPESSKGGGIQVDTRQVLAEHLTNSFHKVGVQPRYTNGTNAWKYPGAADLDPIQIIFYETYDYRVTAWLNEWRREVHNPDTDEYGLPSVYRRQIEVRYFPLDSETPTMKQVYEGCWPPEQQPFELSYAEIDGRITVAGQFVVRKMALSNM